MNAPFVLLDAAAVRGVAVAAGDNTDELEVTLPDGAHVRVARSRIQSTATGYHYPGSFLGSEHDGARVDTLDVIEETFEAVEESLHVNKVPVVREHVRVTTHVTAHDEVVELRTTNEELTIERVPIGRVVEAAAGPRTEGDTLIVPVYEETYVVEKRLVLREELRVTRSRTQQARTETVTLRSEEVRVARLDAVPNQALDSATLREK